ncbi:MAG: hypothetical protein HYY18_12340 [Planctomycetes bacterium]|nr:hypothetical protein [Planctomycetota bacterium]
MFTIASTDGEMVIALVELFVTLAVLAGALWVGYLELRKGMPASSLATRRLRPRVRPFGKAETFFPKKEVDLPPGNVRARRIVR